jgi:aryl-alcohol dehydrogenase-like predicted oxidoreductase
MRYRKLSDTNIEVSEICLGSWVFGGNMWSGSDKSQCVKTVEKALKLGINTIDTAPVYGFGKSEEIIGETIKNKRKDLVLLTKCGLVWEGAKIERCLKPESIKKEIDASLKRLKTDHIDIYQLHWPDENVPLEDTLGAMQELKKSGKIKHIGVCNFDLALLKKAAGLTKIISVQNEYSYLKREMGDSVFNFCREKNIGFFAYGPLGGGILSGKYKAQKSFSKKDARNFFYKFYQGQGYEKAQKAVKILEEIADKQKAPLSQVAINWILSESTVTGVLSGARTPEQIEINANTCLWKLDIADISKLNDFKLEKVG